MVGWPGEATVFGRAGIFASSQAVFQLPQMVMIWAELDITSASTFPSLSFASAAISS